MTTATHPALYLRRLLEEIHDGADAPPGADTTRALVAALKANPDDGATLDAASDRLAALELYEHISAAKLAAEAAGHTAAAEALTRLQGLATAELSGQGTDRGWRDEVWTIVPDLVEEDDA